MKLKYYHVVFLGILLVASVSVPVGLNHQLKSKMDKLTVETADLISEKDNLYGKLKTYREAYEISDSLGKSNMEKCKSENKKLKNKIKELLTVENKSEIHITNYILKYYRKVPPVLAREIAKISLEKSAEHNVSFHVIVAVMEVESNFDPFSVSKLKSDPARGLMQVRYNVWKEALGMKSAYDLHSISGGIDAGTRVLRTYLDQTKNNLEKTLWKYVGKDKAYVRLVYAKMGKFTAFVSSN